MKIRITGLMITKFANDEYSKEHARKSMMEFLDFMNFHDEIDIKKNVQEQDFGVVKSNSISYEPFVTDLNYDGLNWKGSFNYNRFDIFYEEDNITKDSLSEGSIESFQTKIRNVMFKLHETMLFERLECEVAFESQNNISTVIEDKYGKIFDNLQVFIYIQNTESTINKSYSIRQQAQTKKLFDIIEFNSTVANDFTSNKANVGVFLNDFSLKEMLDYYDVYK